MALLMNWPTWRMKSEPCRIFASWVLKEVVRLEIKKVELEVIVDQADRYI